jgi:NAD(P)-dependent dehydrogenase (short-subunit alcohol dehydrogenase family)
MGNLDGKVALVTGAGRGIGRAVALLLAHEGAAVVVNDLGAALGGEGTDESVAAQVAREIGAAGGRAVANTGSVADFAAAGAMVQQAVDTFGRIDIVVNIAGILRDRMIFNMSEAEWNAVIAVHLNGSFNTVRHASPLMRAQGGGRIINFSSVSAWGSPGQPNYGAAKYGLLGFTAVLANSLGRYGVTANAILPYATTRMIDSTPRGQQFAQEHDGKLPSELAGGTEGDPANVAPMVAYLASDHAANINGHFFGVRGNQISLYSHWELAGVLRAERRWEPAELAALYPGAFGLTDTPPAATPGAPRGAAAMQADPATWQPLAPGVDVWERRAYFDAKENGI